jgi:hypothetical protein
MKKLMQLCWRSAPKVLTRRQVYRPHTWGYTPFGRRGFCPIALRLVGSHLPAQFRGRRPPSGSTVLPSQGRCNLCI